MSRDAPRPDQMRPGQVRPDQVRPGQVREVTATSNPVVKEIRGLFLKKNRDETGRFLAEGLKLVTDALEAGWQIHVLVYARNAASNPHLQDVAARARARGALILEASEKVLSVISRKDNPQMAIGVFAQRWLDPGAIRPRADAAGELWIALDRVRDPGNLGTILRTADAAGASGVILVGECTDPFSVEAVRASMGSVFAIPVARMDAAAFLQWRGSFPGPLIGTHLSGAQDYRRIEAGNVPALLLMGNEQQGLPDNLAKACDHLAFIPMAGKADSLNLAIATALMIFELRRPFLNLAQGRGE
jgi:TrmH family RNA methyltransferase